jgi:hypothetical protein
MQLAKFKQLLTNAKDLKRSTAAEHEQQLQELNVKHQAIMSQAQAAHEEDIAHRERLHSTEVERLTQQKLMAEGNEAHHALAHHNMECVERENPKLATGGSPAPRGWQTSDHCSQSGE